MQQAFEVPTSLMATALLCTLVQMERVGVNLIETMPNMDHCYGSKTEIISDDTICL